MEDDKIGSCQIRGEELTVILDTNSVFWRVSGPLGHEELIFHELGHCVLGRDHLNDRLANGNFKSTMRAEGPGNYFTSKLLNQNHSYKRDYYLDELFNSLTPAPCWAIDSFDQSRQALFDDVFFNLWPLTIDKEGRLWVISGSEVKVFNGSSFNVFKGISKSSIKI